MTGNANGPDEILVKDSLLIGQDQDFTCADDMVNFQADPTYRSWGGRMAPKSRYSFTGTNVMTLMKKGVTVPGEPAPWSNPSMGFPGQRGQVRYQNIEFKNIGNTCDSKKAMIINFTPATLDYQSLTVFDSGITFTNADPDNNLVWFNTPSIGPINPGTCIDMECDVWTTPLIIDLAGNVTGSDDHGAYIPRRELGWNSREPQHLPRGLGDYRIPKTALTDLQGRRLDVDQMMPNKGRIRNQNCVFNENMNLYKCDGRDAYHYMHLIIENMDHDTMERRLSPLAIITNINTTEGNVDLYNGPARQGWGERLGLFHTTVAADTEVDLRERVG